MLDVEWKMENITYTLDTILRKRDRDIIEKDVGEKEREREERERVENNKGWMNRRLNVVQGARPDVSEIAFPFTLFEKEVQFGEMLQIGLWKFYDVVLV